MAGAIQGFTTMMNINRSVSQLGQANKASHTQTIRQLETTDAKVERAAQKVVNTAVDIKSEVINAKGNAVDILA